MPAMKLYMHPVSTTSRSVRLYIAENKLPVTEQLIDLQTGEHYKDEYVAINPNRMVPMLEDGDFRLTESSAILKYLASKFDKPDYPTNDLKKRARIDETMDWFNTQLNRDYCYGVVYPQIYPTHKRPTDEHHKGTIAWGKERTQYWLKVLDSHWLGNKPYLTGDKISIADYFGASLITAGDVIRTEFKGHPNIERWLGTMRKLSSWKSVNEAVHGFANAVKDQLFETP
jgi:glutathione S-transferase